MNLSLAHGVIRSFPVWVFPLLGMVTAGTAVSGIILYEKHWLFGGALLALSLASVAPVLVLLLG